MSVVGDGVGSVRIRVRASRCFQNSQRDRDQWVPVFHVKRDADGFECLASKVWIDGPSVLVHDRGMAWLETESPVRLED